MKYKYGRKGDPDCKHIWGSPIGHDNTQFCEKGCGAFRYQAYDIKEFLKDGRKLCISHCDDGVYLCHFNGRFDEGEGTSMGDPVRWKNPDDCRIIERLGALSRAEGMMEDHIRYALKFAEKVYVCGFGRQYEEWWTPEDLGDEQ